MHITACAAAARGLIAAVLVLAAGSLLGIAVGYPSWRPRERELLGRKPARRAG